MGNDPNSLLSQPNDEPNDSLQINGRYKCVEVKERATFEEGQDVKITNCEETYIYINQAVETLLIESCSNCVIFCAQVNKVCSVQ